MRVLCFLLVFMVLSGHLMGGPTARLDANDTVRQVFKGIVHVHRIIGKPKNSINIVKIDLMDENVSFYVTRANKTVGLPDSETKLQTTLDFAIAHGLQVAVNANPFTDLNGKPYRMGDPADIWGLSASESHIYSGDVDDFHGFSISRAKKIHVTDASTVDSSTFNGIAGFSIVIHHGVKTPCWKPMCLLRHPRTLAAVTQDGRYLILATIDGRQPGISEGYTIREAADLLSEFGAYEAVELDGGGSTTLVFQDPTPRVVNVPVGIDNKPKTLRPVANNLGVYAAPVTGS